MSMPKQHPRVRNYEAGKQEIHSAVHDVSVTYNLTYGELLGIVGELLSSWGRMIRRDERHPNDPDKPGDIE